MKTEHTRSYHESAYRTDEVWVMHKCTDCDPAQATDDDPVGREYGKPWCLLLPKGEDPKAHTEVCGRCGTYLGMVDTGEFRIVPVPVGRRA